MTDRIEQLEVRLANAEKMIDHLLDVVTDQDCLTECQEDQYLQRVINEWYMAIEECGGLFPCFQIIKNPDHLNSMQGKS